MAWGLVDDKTGGRYLHMAQTSDGENEGVWFYQKVPVQPGFEYELSFEARGWGGDDYAVIALCAFLGTGDAWIGHKDLVKVSCRAPGWPTATVPAVREFRTYRATVSPPPGTKSVIVRLDLRGKSISEADFRKIRFTAPALTMKEFLERSPAPLPVFKIETKPVSANGVTLTPDWSLDDAEKSDSSCRQQICLNGLWAIQPVDPGDRRRGTTGRSSRCRASG